ncbi:MAG: protein kinase [Myxococcales bacterium]|nr:protein kinase [Myxococcales bacterium]
MSGASPEEEDSTRIRDPLLGAKLDDYLVVGPLGEGGMGVVYEGLHTVINKRVAIKVIKAEFAGDEVLVRRVLAEAQAVNAVRHRGIVDIHAHGRTPDGRPYLVMEMLHGETLHELLTRQGRLSHHEAVKMLLEATGPLFAAHKAGIVHRDLKPSNLFLCVDDDGERFLKLLDFGLAKRTAPGVTSSTMTSASLIVGTPDYMAPEQARAQPTDARTDIYALGVLAFQLLAGELPFTANSSVDLVMKHLSAPVPRLTDLDPAIPTELSDLVAQMMAKEPAQRPQSLDPIRAVLKAQSVAHPNGFPTAPMPAQLKATPAYLTPVSAPPHSNETDDQLEPVPKADRTVIAEVPSNSGVDEGNAATAMSLKQVAPARTTSGHKRREHKPDSVSKDQTALSVAVVRQTSLETVALAEDSVRPVSASRAPYVIGGLLVVVIIISLGVVFGGGKTVVIEHSGEPVAEVKPNAPVQPRVPTLATVETKPDDVKPDPATPLGVKPIEATPADVKPIEATPADVKPKPTPRTRKVPTVAELRVRLDRLAPKLKAAATPDRMLEKKYRKELDGNPGDEARANLAKAIDTLERRVNGL